MLPMTSIPPKDGRDSTPDEDQGVIRCICGIEDDDGFTIQCENCLVWQHAVCVGVDQDNVPDEYLCEKCNPRKLDIKKAIEYQRRRVESEYRHAKESRKKTKYTTGRSKKSDESSERRKRSTDSKQNRSRPQKSSMPRESTSPSAARSGDTRKDSSSYTDFGFTQIDRNILGPDVQVLFQSVLSQLAEQRNVVAAAAVSVSLSTPTHAPIEPYVPTDTAKNEGIDSNSSISHMHTAETRPSDTDKSLLGNLSGAVSGRALQLPAMIALSSDALSNAQSVYTELTGTNKEQKGLFSYKPIARHNYICEYRGQVLLKAAYKEDPKNYYDLLRTTRPYSHFHPEIDLCVDARRQGSEARSIRRSCQPNAVLRSVYVPGASDSSIYLGLFSLSDIAADEEITVKWEWEEGEMPSVSQLSFSEAEDYLGRPEGRRMSKVWRQAFNGGSCACKDTQCPVRRLFAILGVDESVEHSESNGSIGEKRRSSKSSKEELSEVNDTEGITLSSGTSTHKTPDPMKNTNTNNSNNMGVSPAGHYGNTVESQNRDDKITAGDGSNGGGARQPALDAAMLNVPPSQAAYETNGANDRKDNAMDTDVENNEKSTHGYSSGQGTAETDFSSSNGGRSRHDDERRGRKRKSGVHTNEGPNGSALPSGADNVGPSKNSKKRRSSSHAVQANSTINHAVNVLPQKKVWISRYIECVKKGPHGQNAQRNGSAGSSSLPGKKASIRKTRPAPDQAPSPSPPPPAVAEKTQQQPTLVDTEAIIQSPVKETDPDVSHDQKSQLPESPLINKAISKDKDTPKIAHIPPKPSASAISSSAPKPSIVNDQPLTQPIKSPPGDKELKDSAANKSPDSDTKTSEVTDPKTSALIQGPKDNKEPSSAEDEPKDDEGGSKTISRVSPDESDTNNQTKVQCEKHHVVEKEQAPAPKKQRLSLEEYNKRRRVSQAANTNTSTQAGAEAGVAVKVVQEQPKEKAKVKMTLEEYNRRRKVSSIGSTENNKTNTPRDASDAGTDAKSSKPKSRHGTPPPNHITPAHKPQPLGQSDGADKPGDSRLHFERGGISARHERNRDNVTRVHGRSRSRERRYTPPRTPGEVIPRSLTPHADGARTGRSDWRTEYGADHPARALSSSPSRTTTHSRRNGHEQVPLASPLPFPPAAMPSSRPPLPGLSVGSHTTPASSTSSNAGGSYRPFSGRRAGGGSPVQK